MSDLDTLKKIIPPDQAVANKALARGLQQVKKIFNVATPDLAPVLATLENVTDLPLINNLSSPLPANVQGFYSNSFATGTGPGNTITTDDVIGIAAGTTVTTELPAVAADLQQITNAGGLIQLTANGGTPSSAVNGVYTVMQYCLAGAYTTVVVSPGDPGPPPTPDIFTFTVTIPPPLPGQGIYGPADGSPQPLLDEAFVNLINNANIVINTVASTYSNIVAHANECYTATANQLAINVTNCIKADIDIANVVFDIANANLINNATSTTMNFVSSLHDFGLDQAPGGTASFLDRVADQTTTAGQGVIASMREGRNIRKLNEIGILLDTQIPDTTPVGNLSQ